MYMEALGPRIKEVNRLLEEVLLSDGELLSEIGFYSFQGGGKRLRPLVFMLSAASLGAKEDERLCRHSLVFELIHMASLIHDDIVDDSDTRRGRKAAHIAYSPGEAVLAGDYLLAKAAVLAYETESMDFLKILIDVIRYLSLGELYQLKAKGKTDLSRDEYYGIISRKTGALLSAASKAGALAAKADEEKTASLAVYGKNFGLGFQVMDDILDYEADPKSLGKPILKDLGEGRITLPFILAKEALPKDKADRMSELMNKSSGSPSDAEKEEIASLVALGKGCERSHEEARKWALLAQDALLGLPETQARETLGFLAKYSAERSM
jgi:octaprenyl-diphosphate synthase